MTAGVFQLFNDDMEPDYPAVLAVLDSCLSLEVQFVKLVVFEFLLKSLFEEIIDRLFLTEDVLNIKAVLLIELAQLRAILMRKVVSYEGEFCLLIEVQEYLIHLAHVLLVHPDTLQQFVF